MDATAITKGVEAFMGTGGLLAITKVVQEFLQSKREDRKDSRADDERKEILERYEKNNDRLIEAKQEALDAAKREAAARKSENDALRQLLGYRTVKEGLKAIPDDGTFPDRDAMIQVIDDLMPEVERESEPMAAGSSAAERH